MIREYLKNNFDIDEKVLDFCLKTEAEIKPLFENADSISELNQLKVLRAMQKNNLSDTHFNATTGYGYNDLGRDALESIYADVFGAEDALVRPQIISGTHALTVALFGNLRHGDELYSPVGSPYDTLEGVIGHKREVKGSLKEHGVGYAELALLPDGTVDFDNIASKITAKTKLVTIQRSKGYCYRPSLTIEDIGKIISIVKSVREDIICMVDNCYGEFVDIKEPIDVGWPCTRRRLYRRKKGICRKCGLSPYRPGYGQGGRPEPRRYNIAYTRTFLCTQRGLFKHKGRNFRIGTF